MCFALTPLARLIHMCFLSLFINYQLFYPSKLSIVLVVKKDFVT